MDLRCRIPFAAPPGAAEVSVPDARGGMGAPGLKIEALWRFDED